MLNPFSARLYLLLYLIFLIIRPQEFQSGLASYYPLTVTLLLCFVFWLIYPGKSFQAPQYLLMFGLFFVIIISVMLTGWYGGGVKAFLDFGPVVVLFLVTSTSIRTLGHFKQLFLALILLVGVLVYHGIGQAENGIGWTGAPLSQGTRITYIGVFSDPNDLSLAFLFALAASVFFMGKSNGFIVRLLGLVSACFFTYGIFLTQSRGAIVSMFVMLLIYLKVSYGWVRTTLVGSVALIAGFLLLAGRLREIDPDEESAAYRVEAWYEGLQMLAYRPLFGVGQGFFKDHHVITAHNSFVLAFAELGLIGYFFYFSLVVITFMMIFRLMRAYFGSKVDVVKLNNNPSANLIQGRNLLLTLCIAFAGLITGSMFLSRTYFPLTYFLIGLIVAAYKMLGAPEMKAEFIAIPKPMLSRMAMYSLMSIVGVWLLVKILLRTG
jgi:putative inorganic carbon (hco3(-)) transporter